MASWKEPEIESEKDALSANVIAVGLDDVWVMCKHNMLLMSFNAHMHYE